MTGYGRAEAPLGDLRVAVEVRSVNHRFCEVAARLPKSLTAYESRFRKVVQRRVARGRVDVSVSTGGDHAAKRIMVDVDLARQYQEAFQTLKQQLGLPGDVSLDLLASQRDVLSGGEVDTDAEALAEHVESLLGRALDGLDSMRRREGETIGRDVAGRVEHIASTVDGVAARAPRIAQDYGVRLRARVEALAAGVEVDPARVAQEVAMFAERCDYSEEVTRLRSHLDQFRKLLAGGGAVGRSLDFLTQELNREINTIASKANDAEVSIAVVALKSELEKIREQIQNIE